MNKIIPPIKKISELKGKDKIIAAMLFWVNMASLFGVVGIAIPKMLNKMIKKDVLQDKMLKKNTDFLSFKDFDKKKVFKDFNLVHI